MWVLESSGEILQGKRMWLKPGKQYLFGRVKKDGVSFAIDHKTVSRKHFIIDVSPVADNEVHQVHSRTNIKIIDQNSKSGTRVNNEELKGTGYKAKELKLAENSVRPGSLEQELVIKWIPCVLTFYLLKKELKAGALAARQARAKELGIKALSDFLSDHTTHLVAAKRNTPKGLQALITGKHLVSDGFLDALELAATPATLSQDENPSQLELDFDTAWPQEFTYIPAPGREPTVQPQQAYKPGPDRTHIFANYIFVFGDQAQYDLLLPVVTIGHGKALRLNVTYGQTTVEEVFTFMQNAAGRKTFGDPSDSSAGGVILVRWNAPEQYSDWTNNLVVQVSLKLDQRAIDQSEFLDAILANKASQLRQSIALESFTEGLRAPPPSVAQSFAPERGTTQLPMNRHTSRNSPTHDRALQNGSKNNTLTGQTGVSQTSRTTAPQSSARPSHRDQSARVSQTESQPAPQPAPSESNPSQPSTRKSRFIPPIAVKKFNDHLDPNDIVPFEEEEEQEEQEEEDGSELSLVHESELEERASEPELDAQGSSPSQRKRRRPPSPEHDEENEIDDLLPAANAMKRQRRQWEQEARRVGERLHPTTIITASTKPQKKKELDVRAAMEKQRQREKARKDHSGSEEEALSPHNPLDREPANLAVIEYIDLPVRKRHGRVGSNPEDDPRWDDRWNGLKNFKKFKPQEKGAVRKSNHSAKVLVPMVPVAKKTGGLGDQYWDKTEKQREEDRRSKKKQERRRAQESLSQSQGQHSGEAVMLSDDDGDAETSRISPSTARLQEEAAAIVEHEVDVDSPRRTRGDDARQTQTTIQASRVSTARGTKRAAPVVSSTPTTSKRQKTLPVTTILASDDDESSDDEKFRFGKGRGRRGRGR